MSAVVSCQAYTGRGAGGRIHRSGDRAEDRRRDPLPLAANWRLAGVVRRGDPEQFELGRSRPSAAARDAPAPALRPSVRRQGPDWIDRRRVDPRRRAGRNAARCTASSAPRISRRWMSISPRFGTWSVRSLRCLPSTVSMSTRPEKAATCATGRASPGYKATCLSTPWPAARPAWHRTCSPSARDSPASHGSATRRSAITSTRTARWKPRAACAFCATSAAGTSKSLRIWSAAQIDVREGAGTLLDNTCLLFVHEHAEANPHKNNNLALILAGHAGNMKTGLHSRVTGTLGDLYVTVADEVMKSNLGNYPTYSTKLASVV